MSAIGIRIYTLKKLSEEDSIRIGYRLQPLLIESKVDEDRPRVDDDLIIPEEKCSVSKKRPSSSRVRLLGEVSELVGGIIGLRSTSNSPRLEIKRSKNKGIQTNGDKPSK